MAVRQDVHLPHKPAHALPVIFARLVKGDLAVLVVLGGQVQHDRSGLKDSELPIFDGRDSLHGRSHWSWID